MACDAGLEVNFPDNTSPILPPLFMCMYICNLCNVIKNIYSVMHKLALMSAGHVPYIIPYSFIMMECSF